MKKKDKNGKLKEYASMNENGGHMTVIKMIETIQKGLTTEMLNKKLILIVAAIIFVISGVSSCSTKKRLPADADILIKDTSVNDIELGPGDEIEIKFAYTPEFNETQIIRNDGKIELLLVGEIVAEGKSPYMLRNELSALYDKHLSHPELAVILRVSYRNRVYVGGAVNKPGIITLVGKMSILDAIIATGGLNIRDAKVDEILLIREKDNKKYVYFVNVKDYFENGTYSQILLKPMDIVYVPTTKITNVAATMEKIWDIIPFRFSMSYVIEYEDVKKLFD